MIAPVKNPPAAKMRSGVDFLLCEGVVLVAICVGVSATALAGVCVAGSAATEAVTLVPLVLTVVEAVVAHADNNRLVAMPVKMNRAALFIT